MVNGQRVSRGTVGWLLLVPSLLAAQSGRTRFPIETATGLDPINVLAEPVEYRGRKALRVTEGRMSVLAR